MISVKIIADTINRFGKRITTMQLGYPRFIHAEFMTHRVFSRNASSSRAIPVAKMIEQVRNRPAMPVHWGANQAGMQAKVELHGTELMMSKQAWLDAANNAADMAEHMMKLGLHKQVANRILEPFQLIHVVVTATEWDNFFELRAHPDAQPEIHDLALKMRKAMDDSTPVESLFHLPYLAESELAQVTSDTFFDYWAPISAARCARVSYLKHDGTAPNPEDDFKLYERLVGSVPLHASPVEHQAFFEGEDEKQISKNFVGWTQFREYVEAQFGEGHTPSMFRESFKLSWEMNHAAN